MCSFLYLIYACQTVREGVATTFKKLVKEMLAKPKTAQSASASSSSAIGGGSAGANTLKRPSAEVQRSIFCCVVIL